VRTGGGWRRRAASRPVVGDGGSSAGRDQARREVDVAADGEGDTVGTCRLGRIVRDEVLQLRGAPGQPRVGGAPRLEEQWLVRQRVAALPGLEIENQLLQPARRGEHLLGMARPVAGAPEVVDRGEEPHE
jgi:hypothetical protein